MSFLRVFILFLFFQSFCFAVFDYELIDSIYIKTNHSTEELYSSNLNKKKIKNYEARVVLNKKVLKNKTIYLQIFCDVNNIVTSNIKYEKDKKSIFVKVDGKNLDDLRFSFNHLKPKELNFSIINMSKFEYEQLYEYKQLIFGMSFGIVFCAFLYNLIIYFNTFNKAFLYYSGMQLFLFIILFFRQSYVQKTFISGLDEVILDLSATLAMIFILLFSQEVLNLKNRKTNINLIFNFLILISLIDIILIFIYKDTILYQTINRSYIIAIILLTSIYLSLKKEKEAILYSLGWMVIFITLFIMEFRIVNMSENLIYSIGFPLESLFLSFALGYRLKNIIKEKEALLIQQNKLASMGEMLNNIAHQWRQPLANLSFINMDLQLAIKKDEIKKEYLEQISNDSIQQIDFMSQTLDNFKGFYLPNKQKEKFTASKTIKKAIDIIKPSLSNHKIITDFKVINDSTLISYENEYIQIILNILNNAKEALLQNNIQKPYIEIIIDTTNKNKTLLIIQDNAGGIKEDIISKIFDPYFTTKHNNSGIGLYMSKVILDSHLKGNINVRNHKMGVRFEIII